MTLGILSALLDEQRGLLDELENPRKERHAGRTFWLGRWHGVDVVLALTKVGKVAAAITTAALIERFGVTRVLFTGVARGIGPGVNVGDVVVAQAFIQHDLDARPLFPRYEIPLYGRSAVPCDELLTAILSEAVGASLTGADSHFHLENEALRPVMHRGLVASGDCFVGDAAQAQTILNDLAQVGHVALAVEMEGAAVAQVCLDYGVPFAAMRTVSDRADHMAHVDFSRFVAEVASVVACAVLGRFVRMLSEK